MLPLRSEASLFKLCSAFFALVFLFSFDSPAQSKRSADKKPSAVKKTEKSAKDAKKDAVKETASAKEKSKQTDKQKDKQKKDDDKNKNSRAD